jgi:hypothetical protein
MTNGEMLKKIFPSFEELRTYSEHILRDSGHVVITVDCDFWDSRHIGGGQEPCGDAISRQAATDLADELKDDLPDDDHLSDMVMSHNEGILEYQTKLSLLPPATLAEKVGRWIVHPKGIYAHLVCDKCLSNAPYDCRTNYCPNCGAKMEVESYGL